MKGPPERSSRYGRRDPEIEAQKLERRFQAVSNRSFRTRGPRKFKRRSWNGILILAGFAAVAAYVLYTWAWKSNLWPTEHARLQAAYVTDCASARRLGTAPLYRGFRGDRASLDRDREGVACEPFPF